MAKRTFIKAGMNYDYRKGDIVSRAEIAAVETLDGGDWWTVANIKVDHVCITRDITVDIIITTYL